VYLYGPTELIRRLREKKMKLYNKQIGMRVVDFSHLRQEKHKSVTKGSLINYLSQRENIKREYQQYQQM
jgi:hypothetical protein